LPILIDIHRKVCYHPITLTQEIEVVEFSTVEMDEQTRNAELATPPQGYINRAPYREALSTLKSGQVLVISPGEESHRAIKFRINDASKEIGVNVLYGENKDGDILVWLTDVPKPPSRRRNGKTSAQTDA
jgi:hypothetical protein